jgi:hypothetical protein
MEPLHMTEEYLDPKRQAMDGIWLRDGAHLTLQTYSLTWLRARLRRRVLKNTSMCSSDNQSAGLTAEP